MMYADTGGRQQDYREDFPERFMHVAELSRMGRWLMRPGPTVIVSGVRRLIGLRLCGADLRASGLVWQRPWPPRTIIAIVYHLDRGYERMEDRLTPGGQYPACGRQELPATSPAAWLRRLTPDFLNPYDALRTRFEL